MVSAHISTHRFLPAKEVREGYSKEAKQELISQDRWGSSRPDRVMEGSPAEGRVGVKHVG